MSRDAHNVISLNLGDVVVTTPFRSRIGRTRDALLQDGLATHPGRTQGTPCSKTVWQCTPVERRARLAPSRFGNAHWSNAGRLAPSRFGNAPVERRARLAPRRFGNAPRSNAGHALLQDGLAMHPGRAQGTACSKPVWQCALVERATTCSKTVCQCTPVERRARLAPSRFGNAHWSNAGHDLFRGGLVWGVRWEGEG
jgi:hypothetical protein